VPEWLTKAEREGIENRLRALVPAEADRLGITTHVSSSTAARRRRRSSRPRNG
jgi:hypothetical protein